MTTTTTRAWVIAVITVHTYVPAPSGQPAEWPALTRIHVEESFSGAITGAGVVEFLQAASAGGPESFAGIGRVARELGGRAGTFLLQDQGTVEDDVARGDRFVTPGWGSA
jgi:uncharacterized protein DUF3224